MDKIKTGSLITNAVLFVIVLILLRFACCNGGKYSPCPEVGRKTDTVVIVKKSTDTLHTIAQGKPTIREVHVVDPAEPKHDTVQILYNGKPEAMPISSCDTLYYYDSIMKRDTCIITIREQVANNVLIWRELKYQDLHPDKWKVVTNTITVQKKSALFKVYLGAEASGGKSHIDVGPGAFVIIKDWVGVNYNYQVLTGQHNAGVYVKLSFKK
jgi:hypothetical protein